MLPTDPDVLPQGTTSQNIHPSHVLAHHSSIGSGLCGNPMGISEAGKSTTAHPVGQQREYWP